MHTAGRRPQPGDADRRALTQPAHDKATGTLDGSLSAGGPNAAPVDPQGQRLLDATGRRRYSKIITFTDDVGRERWSKAIVSALRAAGITGSP